jgi:hypothetical protein
MWYRWGMARDDAQRPVDEGRPTRWGLVAFVALVTMVLSPLIIVFELAAIVLLGSVWLLRPRWRGGLTESLYGMLFGCVPYLVAAVIAAIT